MDPIQRLLRRLPQWTWPSLREPEMDKRLKDDCCKGSRMPGPRPLLEVPTCTRDNPMLDADLRKLEERVTALEEQMEAAGSILADHERWLERLAALEENVKEQDLRLGVVETKELGEFLETLGQTPRATDSSPATGTQEDRQNLKIT